MTNFTTRFNHKSWREDLDKVETEIKAIKRLMKSPHSLDKLKHLNYGCVVGNDGVTKVRLYELHYQHAMLIAKANALYQLRRFVKGKNHHMTKRKNWPFNTVRTYIQRKTYSGTPFPQSRRIASIEAELSTKPKDLLMEVTSEMLADFDLSPYFFGDIDNVKMLCLESIISELKVVYNAQ